MMRWKIVCLALLVAATAECSFGCSVRAMELKKVSPSLEVFITHQGKAIAGIDVEVFRQGTIEAPVFSQKTDEKGTVRIVGLVAGEYELKASHLGFSAGEEWIQVVENPSEEKVIRRFEFEWADGSPQVSQVAGRLSGLVPGNTGNKLKDIIYPVKTVYPGVAVSLANAFSDEKYDVVSDSGGEFLFGPVKPGIYVLTIAAGLKSVTGISDKTELILDVTPSARLSYLPLKLQGGGCGGTAFSPDIPN